MKAENLGWLKDEALHQLHYEVNYIYESFDEGDITSEIALHLATKAAKSFLHSLKGL